MTNKEFYELKKSLQGDEIDTEQRDRVREERHRDDCHSQMFGHDGVCTCDGVSDGDD
jgi:hypothetical protein